MQGATSYQQTDSFTGIKNTHVHGGGGDLVAKSCPTLVTPWTVAHQVPLSMGFARQKIGVDCH